jgi:cytochrome b6-f complex iron-sulfur subunit
VERKFLPVIADRPLDRRLVLRGLAASLVGAFAGCRLSLDGPQAEGADAGAGTPGSPGSPGSGSASGSGSGSTGSSSGSATDGIARCGNDYCLDLSDPANASLTAVDGARLVTIAGQRMFVVRLDDTQFVALSAVCTHAGCIVQFSSSSSDLECPCHGSIFALDGSVVRGPATSPLAEYPTTYDATTDVVTITIG